MEGEQTTVAEQELPAIGGVENDPATQAEVIEQEIETGEQPEDDGLDELDFGFKKYRVQKELKTAVEDWRSATTKKEQTLAEQTRALEAKAAQQAEADEAELDARAERRAIGKDIDAYGKMTPQDWSALEAQDPVGAGQHWRNYQMLKDRAATLDTELKTASSKRTEAAQHAFAKRVQETLSEAPRIIPGWKAETANQTIQDIVQFANSEGIPEQWLKDNWSPVLLKFLHRARIGSIAMTKATAAPAPSVQAAPIAPLETVAGKSTPAASRSLSDLAKAGNMDAYVAARKSGRAR